MMLGLGMVEYTGKASWSWFASLFLYCRYYVLYKLPNLTFLDSRTVSAMERSEARRKGEFTKIVKPTSALVSNVTMVTLGGIHVLV